MCNSVGLKKRGCPGKLITLMVHSSHVGQIVFTSLINYECHHITRGETDFL